VAFLFFRRYESDDEKVLPSPLTPPPYKQQKVIRRRGKIEYFPFLCAAQ